MLILLTKSMNKHCKNSQKGFKMKKLIFLFVFSVASLYADDLIEQVKHFKQQCDSQNDAKACLAFAESYSRLLNQREGQVAAKKARPTIIAYIKKAAEMCNDPETCIRISEAYFDCDNSECDVESDKFRIKLLTQTCKKFNNVRACYLAGKAITDSHISIFEGGLATKIKYQKEYYKIACDVNYGTDFKYGEGKSACSRLAYVYWREGDKKSALQLYVKDCNAGGESESCGSVAMALEEEENKKDILDRDYTKALKFYKKACDMSNAFCPKYLSKKRQFYGE